jgi:hypothetical protein
MPTVTGFELTGTIEMQGKMNEVATDMVHRFGRALYRKGEQIMARSKEEFVPVDTGVLKSSGRVEPPVMDGYHQWSVLLAYGGAARGYAIKQHETPWYNHRIGQWKYLEQPLMEAVDGFAEDIAADIAF